VEAADAVKRFPLTPRSRFPPLWITHHRSWNCWTFRFPSCRFSARAGTRHVRSRGFSTDRVRTRLVAATPPRAPLAVKLESLLEYLDGYLGVATRTIGRTQRTAGGRPGRSRVRVRRGRRVRPRSRAVERGPGCSSSTTVSSGTASDRLRDDATESSSPDRGGVAVWIHLPSIATQGR
jgi:hypothetical protein